MLYEKLVNEKFEYIGNKDHVIILGDCLEIMENMKKNSADLIFADEPYNIGKNFGNNLDSWKSSSDYINWNKEWIKKAMDILKIMVQSI